MDQNRRQLILASEIRLLEKQKDVLLQELDHIAKQKTAENERYTREIKDLTKRQRELVDTIATRKEELGAITASYIFAKEELEKYKMEQVKQANKELEEINYQAEKTRAEAKKAKMKAETLLLENTRVKEELDARSSIQLLEGKRLLEEKLQLEGKEEGYRRREKELREQLTRLEEDIQGLQAKLDILHEEERSITQKIVKMRQTYNTEAYQMRERQAILELNEKAIENREEELNRREEEVKGAERLLTDRRQTLDRAILEFRQKGVQI